MNSLIRKLLVVAIVILSFSLRFYNLTGNPPSLNWDETSIGYNAYSILKTGRDEWGEFMPIHFKSYGEYKLPGQIYFSVPAIYIFGLNPLGVRITPVIYGTLTVFLLYILVLELFSNRKSKYSIGLISAFFLAISPWHIQLTRASFESSFALFWVIMGMIFLIKGFKNKRWWYLTVFLFALSMYTYNSARGFIPFFLMIFALFYLKDIKENIKTVVLAGAMFLLVIAPIISFMLSGQGSARYKLVSVTDEAGLIPRVEEARNNTKLKTPFKELVLNRYTYVSYSVVKNYLAHFTPDFLFINGAGHKQHHPQNIGELYWIQAPYILLGLFFLIKSKNKFKYLLLTWLLTAFVPVAFTIDSIPHALRTLNAAPVYQVLTGLGVVYIVNILRRRKPKIITPILVASLILLLYQFGNYQYYYHTEYPKLYSRDWQYGNKEVVEYIKDNYEKYDLIVYTRQYGEPHMFTLFYLNYPPEKYQNNENLLRYETNDWVWVERFDKFYFPDLRDEQTTLKKVSEANKNKKILFIGTDEEIDNNSNIVITINFLDGTKAYELIE